MAMDLLRNGGTRHLSEVNPEWVEVAPEHEKIEKLVDTLYSLPLEEFRKVPYAPPPIPTDAPVPGRDINIREAKVVVRDGHNVGIRIYQPLDVGHNHMFFFNIHGGGWTVGTPETEEAQNRFIAAKNQAVVVSVDYRRAPEFPFPYALHDSYDVLMWCIATAESLGIDKNKFVLGGGSAGANVVSSRHYLSYIPPSTSKGRQAAVLAHIVRDEGIPGLIGQMLNIPVTCHPDHFPASKHEYKSYEQNAKAPMVNSARMRLYWSYYLPSATAEPRASPLLASSFSGLPPALIQVAGMDPLRDEGLAYAEVLKNSGVNVSVKIYPGLPHAFYAYPNLKSTQEYFHTMVHWMDMISRNGPGAR
ncbi:lipase esterase family protein [Xylariales sp. AK1849]|nr:lipase esterase family protein [Xylariales sp. AK1849]